MYQSRYSFCTAFVGQQNSLALLCAGKSLTQRLTNYISTKTKDCDWSIDDLMSVMDSYFQNKEFAPSLGTEKGNFSFFFVAIIKLIFRCSYRIHCVTRLTGISFRDCH